MSGRGEDGLDRYEKGGFYRVDDRTGARVRNYDTREEWNGAIVHKDDWEARHPQDFVRSRRDDQSVPRARPVPPIRDGGGKQTVTTANAVAGATTVFVEKSTGFHLNGRVGIMLDNNDRHQATITSLPSSLQISFTPALPFAASSGATVVDLTAPTVSL